MRELIFRFNGKTCTMGKQPVIMGILNVTDDSFSDGGKFSDKERAVKHALQMHEEGVDILDVGGESTRPGAEEVPVEQELVRVVPVIKEIREQLPAIPLSVDTRKAEVARAAMEVGADIINDVSGFTFDLDMPRVAKQTAAGCVIMHMRGNPKTMQKMTQYTDVAQEINEFFVERLRALRNYGIATSSMMLDPGIGFGKTAEQNVELISQLNQFRNLGCPVLIGASRKSFIGHILGKRSPEERDWGTAGAVAAAVMNGADVLRVHEVGKMRDVAKVAANIRNAIGTFGEV